MESPLKQRLIGAAVLAALAIVFLPMLLDGPDVKDPDAAEVPLDLPAAPDDKFETRELTLAAPEGDTPPGGVLGMDTTAPAATPGPVAVAPPVDAAPGTAPSETVAPASAATPSTTPTPPATPAPATPAAATPPPSPAPVAPVPATPKPAAPAAVASGNYALNVGTFTNIDNANTLVTRLRAAKLPVTTESVRLNGGAALRVRVGPYLERAAAEAARLRTDAIAGGSSRVIALDGRALAPAAMPATLPPRPATPVASAPKPVAPTPAPAAPTSIAAASGFAVQLAAPAEESAALGLRDRARSAGFTAFVQRVDTAEGVRYRVRLGPTADRAAADALRESAKQKLGISGNVVGHP